MKGYSGVYAHLGYVELKTYTFESYQRLMKEEEDFLKKLKWHRIPKEVSVYDLNNEHPFWRRESKKIENLIK